MTDIIDPATNTDGVRNRRPTRDRLTERPPNLITIVGFGRSTKGVPNNENIAGHETEMPFDLHLTKKPVGIQKFILKRSY